jgi:glycosyltransferase involved in cell wall biosynthesis
MRVLVSYDTMLPHTTGNYFLDAFFSTTGIEVEWCHPRHLHQVEKNRFDLFVKIDDGLNYHKWREDLHPSVYYIIDSHIEPETNWRKETIRDGGFDYIFTAQKNGAEQLGIDAKWLPLGCDPRKHYQNGVGKIYDVCFIGNFHSTYRDGRIDAVERLFKEFPNFFFGNRTFNEMAQKYAESKIVFNQALNNDVNMRVYEACCSGSFLLTSAIEGNGFEELFDIGKHLVSFDTLDDMIAKAEYFIENDKEREEIARAGREHVLANHTYKHRTDEILRIVKEGK